MTKVSFVFAVAVFFCAAGGVMADAKVAAEAAAVEAERAAAVAKDEADNAAAALFTASSALTQLAVDIAASDAETAAKAAASAAVDAEKAQAVADSAAASSATGGGSLFDVAEGNAGEEAKAAAARASSAALAAKASAEEARKSADAAAKVVVATPIKESAGSLFDVAAGGTAAGEVDAPASGRDDASAVGMEKDTAEAAADVTAAKAALAEAEAKARTFKADADAALMRETEAKSDLAKTLEALREAKVNESAMEERQVSMNAKTRYLGYGGIVLGSGTILYGIIQNSGTTDLIEKSKFSQAEKTAKSRDAAYYFGAAILLSGITIRIMF